MISVDPRRWPRLTSATPDGFFSSLLCIENMLSQGAEIFGILLYIQGGPYDTLNISRSGQIRLLTDDVIIKPLHGPQWSYSQWSAGSSYMLHELFAWLLLHASWPLRSLPEPQVTGWPRTSNVGTIPFLLWRPTRSFLITHSLFESQCPTESNIVQQNPSSLQNWLYISVNTSDDRTEVVKL